MAEIRFRDITDVLHAQLQAANITQQIAWPNVTFVPVKGTPYLKPEISGRNRSPLGFGADAVQQWDGIYQVSIFVPRDTGERVQDGLAQKVIEAFPRGLNLPTSQGVNLIISHSTAAAPVPFGDWANLPVAIHWFLTQPPP